jgi:hypothetical protein
VAENIALAHANALTVRAMKPILQTRLRDALTLADAAQRVTDVYADVFEDDLVLVRAFAKMPLVMAGDRERTFAERVAREAGGTLTGASPVLVLLGSRGKQPEWNGRERSKGHVALPLGLPSFVSRAPMIARLIEELGGKTVDDGMMAKVLVGGLAGVFYVDDARTARDREGRAVIAAQDFVAENDVRTVFAIGGNYDKDVAAVHVFFTRVNVPRTATVELMPLVNVFKTLTMKAVLDRHLF